MEKDPNIINYVAGAFAALSAWVGRALWNRQTSLSRKIDDVHDSLVEHKLKVANEYPTKVDMKDELKPINEKLDKIIDFHIDKDK